MTLNLPLRLLEAVVKEEAWLTGSGPEEAWALRRLSRRGDWGINTQTHLSLLQVLGGASLGLERQGPASQGAGKGAGAWSVHLEGADRKSQHYLRQGATTWTWASSELQKLFFFPPSVSSALCYKENNLNRTLNGFCQDF